MLHISLFSGGGGFDLAAQWMGWKNIVSCEVNPFCNRILQYYWPDAYHHGDIHTLTYEKINEELTQRFGADWRTDDVILTGGFPCQPYSAAGKRLGKEDDRHLWPEMLRAIREIQPKWIVGENVRGLTNWNGGVVFDEVQADLEVEGYEVLPFLLPACAVNAPHRRDRIWIVAYATSSSKGSSRKSRSIESHWCQNNDEQKGRGIEAELNNGCSDFLRDPAYAQCGALQKCEWVQEDVGEKSGGQQPRRFSYDASQKWDQWPTQSPICTRDDEFPRGLDGITFSKWRAESIKMAGNAVVPQLVFEIFKAIEAFNEQHND